MGRSLLAILAGLVVTVLLAVAGDFLLIRLLAPSPGAAVVANNLYITYEVGIGLVVGVIGGFVAANIAGRLAVVHGVALGVLLLVVSVFKIAGMQSGQPEWYQAMLGVIALLSAGTGGWIRARTTAGKVSEPAPPVRRQQRAEKGA
jgi:hypothetical protein